MGLLGMAAWVGLFYLLALEAAPEARLFERKIHTIGKTPQISFQQPWKSLAPSEREALSKIIQFLKRSATGRKILAQAELRARQQGELLLDILQAGQHSLINTTLVRRFSPSQPSQVSYQTRSEVAINRSLSVLDAVLDVAHELTHFAWKESFNPYREDFDLKGLIVSTIEGRGGEVDAHLSECRVLWELFPVHLRKRGHCQKIFDSGKQHFSRAKSIKEFYKVGEHYDYLRSKLKAALPAFKHVSRETPHLISSVYGMPYPVAAVYEYQSIMERVCHNDRERLKLSSRGPARLRGKKHFLSQRCSHFPSQRLD